MPSYDLDQLRALAAQGDDLAQRAAAAYQRMTQAPMSTPQRRHHRHRKERIMIVNTSLSATPAGIPAKVCWVCSELGEFPGQPCPSCLTDQAVKAAAVKAAV